MITYYVPGTTAFGRKIRKLFIFDWDSLECFIQFYTSKDLVEFKKMYDL